MRRLSLLALFLSLLLLSILVVPAAAAGDDDIPGIPFTIGENLSGSVGSADVDDVFSVSLTAGEEVHIRCDPGNASNAGSFRLLAPNAPSVDGCEDYVGMYYKLSGGGFLRWWADFDYIPAKSGTYYLWVHWSEGPFDYKLSVTRTSREPLDLSPDSNSIPGTTIGPGTVTGVVSTNVDESDVYSVPLKAGRPVMIRLTALTSSIGYLSLLDPGATSLSARYSHGIGERVGTVGTDTAEIYYTPAQTATYYLLVEVGGGFYCENFPYQLSVTETGAGGEGFWDVSGSPYETAIYDLADRQVISGYEDGTFRPKNSVTRQQFAKMIVKALGLTVTGSETCPFMDVSVQAGSDPFYPSKYVAVCASHGITTGKTATTFAPDDNITHQQLITMVVRAAALPEPPADYEPDFTATRFSLDEHYQNARKAAYAGLLEGLEGVPSYDRSATSTRGQCAQILYNLLHMQ